MENLTSLGIQELVIAKRNYNHINLLKKNYYFDFNKFEAQQVSSS